MNNCKKSQNMPIQEPVLGDVIDTRTCIYGDV